MPRLPVASKDMPLALARAAAEPKGACRCWPFSKLCCGHGSQDADGHKSMQQGQGSLFSSAVSDCNRLLGEVLPHVGDALCVHVWCRLLAPSRGQIVATEPWMHDGTGSPSGRRAALPSNLHDGRVELRTEPTICCWRRYVFVQKFPATSMCFLYCRHRLAAGERLPAHAGRAAADRRLCGAHPVGEHLLSCTDRCMLMQRPHG